jgi:hypothetical protein
VRRAETLEVTDLVDLARVLVAASVGTTPKLTRLASATGPIQKAAFLLT